MMQRAIASPPLVAIFVASLIGSERSLFFPEKFQYVFRKENKWEYAHGHWACSYFLLMFTRL